MDVGGDAVVCIVERGAVAEVVADGRPFEVPEQPAMANDDATRIAPSDNRPSSMWSDSNL